MATPNDTAAVKPVEDDSECNKATDADAPPVSSIDSTVSTPPSNVKTVSVTSGKQLEDLIKCN